jgi:hypothetical protein
MGEPLRAQGIIRDGLMLALRKDRKTMILRSATGEIVAGCELIVKSIENHEPFSLDGLPNEIVQAIKQVVMPANSFRDGGDGDTGGDNQTDRP